MNAADWRELVAAAPLPEAEKQRLLALTPATCVGLAARLARRPAQGSA